MSGLQKKSLPSNTGRRAQVNGIPTLKGEHNTQLCFQNTKIQVGRKHKTSQKKESRGESV